MTTPEGTSMSTWLRPMPRMLKTLAEPKPEMVTAGAAYCRAYRFVTALSSMASAVRTEAEIELVCRLLVRREAVTTISSSFSDAAGLAAGDCACAPPLKSATGAAADKHKRNQSELRSLMEGTPRAHFSPWGHDPGRGQ